MKILITGGAGFIGSNLISCLLESQSCQVVCFDNFDDTKATAQKRLNLSAFYGYANFTLVEGDICDMDDLYPITDVDVIIHLAAKTNVRLSFENAAAFHTTNVHGTRNLLEFARLRGVRQFIFASSSSVYGINPGTPWAEDENAFPISPYAHSKLLGEKIGQFYSQRYGIRFLALRFFNVFGPAQRPDQVICRYFRSIMQEQPLEIWGNGSSGRDYTFIDDVVRGICSSIGYKQSDFEVINVGSGQVVRLIELIAAMEQVCRKKATIEYLPEHSGDLLVTHASIAKAGKLLNYTPRVPFKTGLKAFYDWCLSTRYAEVDLPRWQR